MMFPEFLNQTYELPNITFVEQVKMVFIEVVLARYYGDAKALITKL